MSGFNLNPNTDIGKLWDDELETVYAYIRALPGNTGTIKDLYLIWGEARVLLPHDFKCLDEQEVANISNSLGTLGYSYNIILNPNYNGSRYYVSGTPYIQEISANAPIGSGTVVTNQGYVYSGTPSSYTSEGTSQVVTTSEGYVIQ